MTEKSSTKEAMIRRLKNVRAEITMAWFILDHPFFYAMAGHQTVGLIFFYACPVQQE
jgi:serine protease inhibitor